MNATIFEHLRYGYFDIAFGNMLKAIRGGANPIGVTTLCMCCIGALSSVEWALDNQGFLDDLGGLREMTQVEKKATGCFDKTMFEGWLRRWVIQTDLNRLCDPPRVYGTRCALIHTGGGAEALLKTGVRNWEIRASHGDRARHYVVNGATFSLYMPDFIAEIVLASDKFLFERKEELNLAEQNLQKRLRGIGVYSKTDYEGNIVGYTLPRKPLSWFDPQDDFEFSKSPLSIQKIKLADSIQAFYTKQDQGGLVLPEEFRT